MNGHEKLKMFFVWMHLLNSFGLNYIYKGFDLDLLKYFFLPGQDWILHAPLSALFVLLLSLWLIIIFFYQAKILNETENHVPKGENIVQRIITIMINSIILIIKNSKVWYFRTCIFSDIPMDNCSVLSIHNFFVWKGHVGITTITIWFIWFKMTNATWTTVLTDQKLTQNLNLNM